LSKPSILQFLFRRRLKSSGADDLKSSDPERRGEGLFRRGRSKMRAGKMEAAIAEFEQALKLLPGYAEAVAARAESLDTMGRIDEARGEYERARRLWADERPGAADRRYLFRQRGRFTFEVDSYELALLRVKTGSFPHLACGNALLVQGHAEHALKCYERALKIKPNDPDLVALKGEALSMMGSYKLAIEAFDYALAANPKEPESLNARAIAKLGLGDLAGANADWRRQLELLPEGQFAARACVALRLADYGGALPELERAVAIEPNDPYWQLYRRSALSRLGKQAGPLDLPAGWLHPAQLAFHKGAAAAATDKEAAKAHWKEAIELGPVSMIEVCAAHNELSRL
jgi:tetratricopeptide (TPR) repeat protein